MKVSIFVADAAQESGGKLNALGIGWTRIGTPLSQFAIIGLVEMDNDQAGATHSVVITLCHPDGTPVQHPLPRGGELLCLESRFAAQSTHDLEDSESIRLHFAVPVAAGMPIAPGGYRLSAVIDEDPDTRSVYRFRVR